MCGYAYGYKIDVNVQRDPFPSYWYQSFQSNFVDSDIWNRVLKFEAVSVLTLSILLRGQWKSFSGTILRFVVTFYFKTLFPAPWPRSYRLWPNMALRGRTGPIYANFWFIVTSLLSLSCLNVVHKPQHTLQVFADQLCMVQYHIISHFEHNSRRAQAPTLHTFHIPYKNVVKVSIHNFSWVCRWMSNAYTSQFSRRYRLQEESYEGRSRTCWPTLVTRMFNVSREQRKQYLVFSRR